MVIMDMMIIDEILQKKALQSVIKLVYSIDHKEVREFIFPLILENLSRKVIFFCLRPVTRFFPNKKITSQIKNNK